MEEFFPCHKHQDRNGGRCYARPERTLFSRNFLPISGGRHRLPCAGRVCPRREAAVGQVCLGVGRALVCGPVPWPWPRSATSQLSPDVGPWEEGLRFGLGCHRELSEHLLSGPGPSGFPLLWTWKCPQRGMGERAQGQGGMGVTSGGQLARCPWVCLGFSTETPPPQETQGGWLPAKVMPCVTVSAMPSDPVSLSQFRQ